MFVSTFYSIVEGSACPGLNLWDQFDPLGEMTPRHLLPINLGDACGDNVCIAITGASFGTVFTWEHVLYDYSGGRPWLEPWELAVAAVAPSSAPRSLESLQVDPKAPGLSTARRPAVPDRPRHRRATPGARRDTPQ